MGKVYLVGAGPGAPDLLTLRAARLLEAADVVLHDALVHPGTLALAKKARFLDVGKRYGKVSTEQRFIHRALIEAARTHDVVVRLKGGDPMLFGRAQEEIAALEAAGVPYEVVPGITAALAAAAQLRTSLTQRGRVRSFAFATPRAGEGEDVSHWVEAFRGVDAGAIYMGLRCAPAIADALISAGRAPATPVAIVVDASLPSAQTYYTTLAGLPAVAQRDIGGPALLLVGPQFHRRTAVSAVDAAAWRALAQAG